MTVSFVRAGAWVLLQAAQADTVLMRQVGQDPGWFEKATAVASGLMTVAILVLTVALVPAAWNFRKSYKKVNDLLDRIYGDITPIMRHASSISDNVDFITTSIRTDVQKVNATINTANERVQRALSQAEHRLNEFNALLAVVQDEAEGVFVSTASTVRGVRSGAAAFRGRGGTDLASEELDTAELVDEAELLMDDTEIEEERDGHDGNPEPAAEALPAAPRLRPRARSRRRA